MGKMKALFTRVTALALSVLVLTGLLCACGKQDRAESSEGRVSVSEPAQTGKSKSSKADRTEQSEVTESEETDSCTWFDAFWRLDGSGKSDAVFLFRAVAFLPDTVFCRVDV